MNCKTPTFILLLAAFSSCSTFMGIRTKSEKPDPDVKIRTERYSMPMVQVEQFELAVLDSSLNLFKNNGLIRIEISGFIQKKGKIYFDKFTFIERNIQPVAFRSYSSQSIDIVPAFREKKPRHGDRTVYFVDENGRMHFKTTLEYRFYSVQMGLNRITVNFMDQSCAFVVVQQK